MKRRFLFASVLALVVVLFTTVPTTEAYVLIGGKQQFYYPGVIAFKWGTLTTTNTEWRKAFNQAAYNWYNVQDLVSWGEVAQGTDNIMQVYLA